MSDTLTTAWTAPTRLDRGRPNKWAQVFTECRNHPGQWRRCTIAIKSRAYAAQIASDIRNAHHRHDTNRPTGINPGETWEAEYEADSTGTHHIILRYLP